MLNDFKTFLLRGNVVDLAVAIVIGVAFRAVITAFVEDLVTPLIAATGWRARLLCARLHDQRKPFLYGDFINKVINVPNHRGGHLLLRRHAGERPDAERKKGRLRPTLKKCPECLSESRPRHAAALSALRSWLRPSLTLERSGAPSGLYGGGAAMRRRFLLQKIEGCCQELPRLLDRGVVTCVPDHPPFSSWD